MSPPVKRVLMPKAAFTLVEILVGMTLLSLILLVIFAITQATGSAWSRSRAKVDAFQSARQAFESITRSLSQATLNTYYDYFDSSGRSPRDAGYAGAHRYGRQSELHFVAGKSLVPDQVTHALFFQVPGGYAGDPRFQNMSTVLNACGFYVALSKDASRPAFLDKLPNSPPNRTRYRLMEFLQPTEKMSVYSSSSGLSWFKAPLAASSPPVEQLAANVIAFVVLPRKSAGDGAAAANAVLSDDYEYDSRAAGSQGAVQSPTHHQLPPLVEVILVAVDEQSAARIEEQNLQVPALFSSASQIDGDLDALEIFLNQNRLVYRIFRTTVPLRNAKWSS